MNNVHVHTSNVSFSVLCLSSQHVVALAAIISCSVHGDLFAHSSLLKPIFTNGIPWRGPQHRPRETGKQARTTPYSVNLSEESRCRDPSC